MQRFIRSRPILCVVFLLLPWWGTGCAPDPPVLLQGEMPLEVGDSFRETMEVQFQNGKATTEVEDVRIDGTMSGGMQKVVEWEVLSEDTERWDILLEVERMTYTFLDSTRRQEDRGSLEGLSLRAKKVDGNREFSLEEGTPDAEQLADLEALAETPGPSEIYPENGIQVGDRWELSPAFFEDWITERVLEVDGTGTMEFLETVDHDGHACARLQFEFAVEAVTLDRNGDKQNMELVFKGEILRALDLFEDLSVKASGTWKAKHRQFMDGRVVVITMEAGVTVSQIVRKI